jgi:hypothetical protein
MVAAVLDRIISISSAPGWSARIAEGEHEYTVTLLVWALLEGAGGGTQVVGLVQRSPGVDVPPGTLRRADEIEGFAGYKYKGLGPVAD